jgi:hypothetical protein
MFTPMQTAVILALMYLACGVAIFAYPRGRATADDFSPLGQIAVFCDTLPLVLTWPIAVWRLLAARR